MPEANSRVRRTVQLSTPKIYSRMLLKTPDTPKDLMRVLIAAGLWSPLSPMRYATRPETWGVAYVISKILQFRSIAGLSTHHAGSTDVVRTGGSSDPGTGDVLSGCEDVYDRASEGGRISRECAKKGELSFTRS